MQTRTVVRVSSLAAVATASSAQAAIVTNTSLGLSGFTHGPSSPEFFWNIDNANVAETRIKNSGGTYKDLLSFANGFAVASSAGKMKNLTFGATVGATSALLRTGNLASMFSYGAFNRVVGFTADENGYIGFRFNPSGSQVLWGWAEVILNPSPSPGTFQVLQWAYDDSGAPIEVGQTASAIPEPAAAATGLGALALGAAALKRRRRETSLAAA